MKADTLLPASTRDELTPGTSLPPSPYQSLIEPANADRAWGAKGACLNL